MYEPNFFRRLWGMGPQRIILSYDVFAGIIAFAAVYIHTGGGVSEALAADMLSTFAVVSASIFAIVLTGLTIITSFTDRLFLYAWQEVGEFENIVTTFQFNLGLPVLVLLASIVLQLQYSPLGMIALIALFVYMLFSLLDLVGFVTRYALQRGEFVHQQVEKSIDEVEKNTDDVGRLSNEELLRVRKALTEREQDKE